MSYYTISLTLFLKFKNNRKFVFQQDTLKHNTAVVVEEYSQNKICNRWIGTYETVDWATKFPDLTPSDFFLWRHLKNVV